MSEHQPDHSDILFQGRTRRFAFWLLTAFLFIWLLVVYYFYQSSWHTALARAENEVRKMGVMQQAIRGYVDEQLKPLFYQLKAQGQVPADFYAPQGFSATYVISHVFERYSHLIKPKAHLLQNGVCFHVVSDNPLNPHNRATLEQLRWLQYFRDHPLRQEAVELIQRGLEPQTFRLYRPSPPNTQACLRCHGDPQSAPSGLLRLYDARSGFGEKVGWIRGMSIYEIDLHPIWQQTVYSTFKVALLLFVLMLLVAGAIIWVYRHLVEDRAIILAQKEQLFLLANCDALTGLFNRHRLKTLLHQKLDDLRAGRLKSLTAVLLDIDYFKRFNDRFGHDVGDRVLIHVAQALKGLCLGAPNSVFRLGGEEFLILIEDLPVETVCEQLRSCHAQLPNTFDDVPDRITYSIGVAVATADDTPPTLLKKADLALYHVKEHGRNGVACYHQLPEESSAVEAD